MPLVTTTEFLKKAQDGHYAVGAFNVENLEMAQAVIQAATELNAPVIIQTTSSTVKYASLSVYRAIVAALAESAPVPVAMHLDHGSSYELCEQAACAGYTSVMIDGSKLSFEENIAVSAKTAAMAKQRGIPTEAELGTVGGKEDDHVVLDADAMYTNPEKAREFVERTGVGSLAVAIGTAFTRASRGSILTASLKYAKLFPSRWCCTARRAFRTRRCRKQSAWAFVRSILQPSCVTPIRRLSGRCLQTTPRSLTQRSTEKLAAPPWWSLSNTRSPSAAARVKRNRRQKPFD